MRRRPALLGGTGALACLLLGNPAIAETFRFTLDKPAEVIAGLDISSPGSNWAKKGSEAALATLTLDGSATQHIMLYAGELRYTYSAFLGALSPGEHQLTVVRNQSYSAEGSEMKLWSVHFRQIGPDDPDWVVLAHAPILYARANTVGAFTDIPLLTYCERLAGVLQYTVIFSNEDGGTSTRALMARWGRTTDIEYVYKAWLDSRGQVTRATIQAKGHEEVEFQGRSEGSHPLLIPSTQNNMVSGEGSSPIRYQIPPVVIDLSAHSREQTMDEHPILYRVMAQELEREGKLRPFGTVDGEKVSDPRNYLYLEARVTNLNSALAALVRLEGEKRWRSSYLGRADYAISRDGWFRTTVELPPGVKPRQVAEIGFQCILAAVKPEPVAGVCRLEAVSKSFFLDSAYQPGSNLWTTTNPVEIPTGEMRTFR